ncbi:GNAT family protein [Actinoplanes sp. NPDC051470]|uniref:GNAT family N-acetyltransferase n=1 Tax=Actinoplanes sp. NPDC051470 TaxID=3157224 RepID=UPI003434D03A
MSVPEINGTGVRLRALAEAELDDVVAGWPEPASRWGAAGAGAWAIADPATDRLLGAVALDHQDPARGQAEALFWVRPDDRRRGVATAALTALAGWALDAGHWARLELLIPWQNAPAQRVALAAGFAREGVRRGVLADDDGTRAEAVAFARVAGDAPGPVPRLLPDFPGGELTDGVVTLRPLVPDDIPFYTALHLVRDVVETTVPPTPPSTAQIRHRCTAAEAHWLAGIRADLVIADVATGTPTGNIGLFYMEPGTGQAMIGYSMLPEWRGRGYATRAAKLISLWVFAETGIARLIAGTTPTNVGSQRVLERAGFRQEAFMRSRLPGKDDTRQDDLQYVLLPEDVLNAVSTQP